MRGLKMLSVTPGGNGAVVLAPQSPHGSVCRARQRARLPVRRTNAPGRRYSVTSGLIGGTSITCRRLGVGSSPRSGAPHSSHDGGLSSTILSTLSGGRSGRVVPLWPGWPPRFRPEGLFFGHARQGRPHIRRSLTFGRAATFGGSDDGGF